MQKTLGAEVEYIKGHGGDFEVTMDGRLIFSKRAAGRFPTSEEIIEKAKAMS